MRVFKCFFNYTKEEKWLNDMARKGSELVKASFCYTFRKIDPEEATYRIDCRTFKSKEDFIDYCTMFEDFGWKHIFGSKSSGHQYFKKLKENSDDDIFSDSVSKSSRYKRLSSMWMTCAISYLPIAVALSMTGSIKFSNILNPSLFYYTPGLWNKTGASFIGSFLFETPFALMRMFPTFIFQVLIILYLIFAYKAHKLSKEPIK